MQRGSVRFLKYEIDFWFFRWVIEVSSITSKKQKIVADATKAWPLKVLQCNGSRRWAVFWQILVKMNGFSGTAGPVAVEGVSGLFLSNEHKRSSNGEIPLSETGKKIRTAGPEVIIQWLCVGITSEQLFVGLEGEKCVFNKLSRSTLFVTVLTVITSDLVIIGNIVTKVVLYEIRKKKNFEKVRFSIILCY